MWHVSVTIISGESCSLAVSTFSAVLFCCLFRHSILGYTLKLSHNWMHYLDCCHLHSIFIIPSSCFEFWNNINTKSFIWKGPHWIPNLYFVLTWGVVYSIDRMRYWRLCPSINSHFAYHHSIASTTFQKTIYLNRLLFQF